MGGDEEEGREGFWEQQCNGRAGRMGLGFVGRRDLPCRMGCEGWFLDAHAGVSVGFCRLQHRFVRVS
jgi:hypothetical protein